MAVIMGLTEILHLLQHLTPVITILYFVVATLVSVVKLQTLDADISPRLRKTVFGALLLFMVLYLAQAGLVIDLIFVKPGLYGSRPTNLHALESALVWLIISSSLLSFESCTWHPYCGSWLIALASEVTILALSMAVKEPNQSVEYSLVSVQGAQILLLILLTAVFATWRKVNTDPPAKDEETAPLLQSADTTNGYAGTNADNMEEGAADDAENDGSDDETDAQNKKKKTKSADADEDSDSDDESEDDDDNDEDWWAKKTRQGQEKMKKRLKQEGGWYGYLKGFSVFLPYIWPARSFKLKLHLFGVVLCMLAERVLRPLQPTQLGRVVDSLASGSPRSAFSALALYIVIDAIQSNIGIVRGWLWLPIETNTENRMEKASYNHIMELSCNFHDSKQSGEVFEAMRQGQSVVDLIETIGFEIIPDMADLLIACGYFYYLFGPYMTLAGISTGVVYIVLNAWTTSRSSHVRRRMNKAWRAKYQVKYDTVPNWKTVSYFNRIPHSEKKYSDAIDRSNNMYLSWRLFMSLMSAVQSSLMDVGQFGAFVLVTYDIMFKGMPVGRFVVLNNYWGSITSPLIGLSRTLNQMIMDLIDAEALLKIWKTKPDVPDGEKELVLNEGLEGHVKFDNVDFKYHKKKGTIKNLSFEAAPGQTIALVGETGAGKSTILKLLFRFYDVTGGSIAIDGQDIRSVTLDSLRESIATVPQDPAMFNTTIMENLRYVRLDATDEEIHEACRAAAVHDKIMKFRKGYDSKVGERGVKLSGGELQRVAIARAILKRAPIILLDEATSSVDSETEALIQEGLKRLCHGKTTFIVAHRLSTIQHADRILVIKDGQIEEEGTPAELLNKEGKYYKLWSKQMGIFDPFAPKKPKKDTSDSDQSTLGNTDEDLIELEVAKRTKPSTKQDSKTSELKMDGKEPALNLDTKPSLAAGSSSVAASPSPAKSPSKAAFRPNAPEFVPRSRGEGSQSESYQSAPKPDSIAVSQYQQDSTGVAEQGTSRSRAHSRRQSQSESGTSATSRPMSRPGTSGAGGPGLLALQQASITSDLPDSSRAGDSKR